MNMRRLAARTRACSMGRVYRPGSSRLSTGAPGYGTRRLGMQPTRPPDDRRARHEATGEWPQPPLSALLDERVRRTPDRLFMIEGQREGGRSYTFADLSARAERIAAGRRRSGVGAGDAVSCL